MVFNSNISFSLQYAVTKNIFYTCTGTFASHFEIYIVWFQKISIPPPRRELEIPEGWGGSKAQEIPEGGGGLTVELSSRWFSLIQYRPTAVVVRKLLHTDFSGTF